MTIPGGQTAKLIKISEPFNEDFRVTEVADHLKFIDGAAVCVIAGGMGDRAGSTMAGLSRGVQHRDGVIVDSGMMTCVEKWSMRMKTRLIGVAPSNLISYPQIK